MKEADRRRYRSTESEYRRLADDPVMEYFISVIKAKDAAAGDAGFSASDIADSIDPTVNPDIQGFMDQAIPFLQQLGVLHYDDKRDRYRLGPKYRPRRRSQRTPTRHLPSARDAYANGAV